MAQNRLLLWLSLTSMLLTFLAAVGNDFEWPLSFIAGCGSGLMASYCAVLLWRGHRRGARRGGEQ